MANPPPPYDDITGISRAVMKDNAQITLAQYNGNARPGELVVNLETNPPAIYVGNNSGQLTAVTTGGTYGNANVVTLLATFGSNTISTTGNITGGNISATANISVTGNILANNIGTLEQLSAKYIIFDTMPMNNLPNPAGNSGLRGFVNDANLVAAGNFGAQVSDGGGTGGNTVPVWSDGFNWYIG
jgi:hypothetical protein